MPKNYPSLLLVPTLSSVVTDFMRIFVWFLRSPRMITIVPRLFLVIRLNDDDVINGVSRGDFIFVYTGQNCTGGNCVVIVMENTSCRLRRHSETLKIHT